MAGSDLAETESASRKPTKALEFSPQVNHFFRRVYEILRGETGDF